MADVPTMMHDGSHGLASGLDGYNMSFFCHRGPYIVLSCARIRSFVTDILAATVETLVMRSPLTVLPRPIKHRDMLIIIRKGCAVIPTTSMQAIGDVSYCGWLLRLVSMPDGDLVARSVL